TRGSVDASFYQAAGAEIDLLLTFPDRETWAIEIKRSTSPKAGKGFHTACRDVQATHKFIVYPAQEQFTTSAGVRVTSLAALAHKISETLAT
ncbi:MAG: ATPase, partial [Pseudomonadota bacterium]|nr:ATPase [Pseudomonadota bacterium]